MSSINKATARPVFFGWEDQSGNALPVELEQLPIHLPRFFLQSPKGPETDQLVSGAEFLRMYGDKTVDELSKYFSHQTVAAITTNARGNSFFVKRMLDTTAKKARIALCAEVVTQTFEKYVRDPQGVVTRDINGDPVVDPATTFDGKLVRWVLRDVGDLEVGVIPNQTPGSLVGKTGEQSTIYPILEFEASHKGEYGNNVGFRLSVPHLASQDPADDFVVDDQKTLLYRLALVERPAVDRTPVVQVSRMSERAIDFSLKEGVTNTNTNQTFEVDRVVTNYSDFAKGRVPVYGPLGNAYVYEDNIATILADMKTVEEAATGETIEDEHMVNMFTAVSWEGYEHEAIRLAGDTLELNSVTTHYMKNGADGEVSYTKLDELTRSELQNGWEAPENPVKDTLKYPFSCMYDTGFTLDTKREFFKALGVRQDIHVAVCTHVEGATPNDIAADTSVAQVLLNAARLVPESTVYGTGVCRAVITRSTGVWIDSTRKRTVPLLIDLIDKRAGYLGAGNGVLKTDEAYDIAPKNNVAKVEAVTNTYVPESPKDKFWDLGANGVQSVSRHDLFWPAIQTVYENSTSVLNSDLVMQVMVDITKKAEITWAQTTGDSRSTDAQFFAKQLEIFDGLTADKYDGRVVIRSRSYKSPTDEIRGFSNTMEIAVYADVMRTVTQFNMIARRRSDLSA